jgi:hypothetical protein
MSFPGTYNINYYYGDTLEFRVFPKNSSGEPFDLTTFTNSRFTLAPSRTSPVGDQIVCFAQIDPDKTNVFCAIRPEDSDNLNPETQYVYDIEIFKAGEPYDVTYTLLTGSVSITNDVTRPTTGEVQPLPNNPTNLIIGTKTANSIDASWTAPSGGGTLTQYKIAAIPFTTDETVLETAISSSTTVLTSDNLSATFAGLDPDTDYSLIVIGSGPGGDASLTTLLTNDNPERTLQVLAIPDAPVINSTTGSNQTIEVNFTPGADGNSAITNYKYSLDGTAYTAFEPPQTSSPLTISGLLNGTEYPVTIRAVNAIGDSSSSNAVTETPKSVPDAPTITGVAAQNESIEIFFAPGADNGSSITNYSYSLDDENYTLFDPATISSPLTVTGLTNGTTYSVSIKAINSEGSSLSSSTTSVTPIASDLLITNDGTGAYLIEGVPNDTITLLRGETYSIVIDAPGHPFWVQTVSGAYSSGNVYNDGITNNGTDQGVLTWIVQESAPNTLYYACEFHSSMQGTINIIDGVS